MRPLGALEGYRLWAPNYSAETVVSEMEDRLVRAMTPPLGGLRLLDAGCGTGRRLADAGAGEAIGVDICEAMLTTGIDAGHCSGLKVMVGDLRALPLPDRSFDVIWCRLAIGHVDDCASVYSELARVADGGARIIVSDFHPDAFAAGHRRTFRENGRVHEIEHFQRSALEHIEAARAVGLDHDTTREAAVGPAERHFYQRADRLAQYDRDLGLPLVLALGFRRAS